MTNDKVKSSDSKNKSNMSYNLLDKLSNEKRHTIWRPYAKEATQIESPPDSRKIDIQIERQTNDMKRDIRERALIKKFVFNFLLSKCGLPVDQAIPLDENEKLRFPIDQREAQAMKQLVDACYMLDDFVTKMKDIENHLTEKEDTTSKNPTFGETSSENYPTRKRASKERQMLELMKSRLPYIKGFCNLVGLQKSIEDTEELLKTPSIENDKNSDLELNGDNLVKMWAKYIVAETKKEVKSSLEWDNQKRKYGIFGASRKSEDWEHGPGTGPKDVAKISQEKIEGEVNQILPRDSIVRRKLIECSITHINKQINVMEQYDINRYLYGDKHDNKPHKTNYNLDPDTIIDFTKIKIEKREDRETRIEEID